MYRLILERILYLRVLAKSIVHCCLCRLFSIALFIYQHTQALYWNCIGLVKDIHKNLNVPWMITCTHSAIYNSFNLSKAFIKIAITTISTTTDCLFVLPEILRGIHCHELTIRIFFLFNLCSFSLESFFHV